MSAAPAEMRIVANVVRPKRRTDKVLDAIQHELEVRRSSIDTDATIRSITVIVKIKQGSDAPRAVLMTVETERTLGGE